MSSDRFEFTHETLQWCIERVNRFADALSHCRNPEENDQPTYNLTADALEWQDDYPQQVPNDVEFHQWYAALLNARTSIALGILQANSAFVEEVEKNVPSWPGNAKERRSEKLRETFNALRTRELRNAASILDRTN